MGFVSEKQLKKVLTSGTKIVYHSGRFENRKDFCPVGFFVCWDPSKIKNNPNTTGKEKEHINAFIESS